VQAILEVLLALTAVLGPLVLAWWLLRERKPRRGVRPRPPSR